MPILKAFVYATILIGLLGILFRRNLLLKILAMDVMGTGIVSLFVLVAARPGHRPPIASAGSTGGFADPLPQAAILTAIVIGFSVLALLLVCATILARRFPTLDSHEIESPRES
jgi:multicomponent Na+:H+ antiporter subunit C